LFSQKKRPPFASDEGWDEYDFPVTKKEPKKKPDEEPSKSPEPIKSSNSKTSWITGLFENF